MLNFDTLWIVESKACIVPIRHINITDYNSKLDKFKKILQLGWWFLIFSNWKNVRSFFLSRLAVERINLNKEILPRWWNQYLKMNYDQHHHHYYRQKKEKKLTIITINHQWSPAEEKNGHHHLQITPLSSNWKNPSTRFLPCLKTRSTSSSSTESSVTRIWQDKKIIWINVQI